MAKSKKTKAPLETKQEEAFWKERLRQRAHFTIHLLGGETISGPLEFASDDTLGISQDGATRLLSRDEITYLEDHAGSSPNTLHD